MGMGERKERVTSGAVAVVPRHLEDMACDQTCEHSVSRTDAAAKQRRRLGRSERATRHRAERAGHGVLVLSKRAKARVQRGLDAEAIDLQFGEPVRYFR